MIVRSVEPADAEAILRIYGPIVLSSATSFEFDVPSADEMRARIARTTESFPWIVAEADGEFVGYAYATTFRARVAYRFTAETSVYVAESARGRGIGRALMTQLLEKLKSRGFRTIVAGITLPNDASVRIHESLGFAPAGVIPNAGRKFDAWHDVGFWTLDLAD